MLLGVGPSAGQARRRRAWRQWSPRRAPVRQPGRGDSDIDLDQLVALCRRCHGQTNAWYGRGRLVVAALGGGRFAFEVSPDRGRRAGPVFGPTTRTDGIDLSG